MITTENFIKPCGCRSVGDCQHNAFAEFEALDSLVDAFAIEMKTKLRQKALEGKGGWDDPDMVDFLMESLAEHIERGTGQEVDIANIAAMLWNMGHNEQS